MKILNICLSLLFVLSALVQYNDPDPYFWIAIYLLTATICGLAIFQRYHPVLILLGLAICTIELIGLFPDFINWINQGMPNIASEMKTDQAHIELTREFLGLLICEIALVFQYLQMRRLKQKFAKQSLK